MRSFGLASIVAFAALGLAACSDDESGEGADDEKSQALGVPAAVRVLGLPEPVGPQHIGISGPSPCPSAGPYPGSNENRFWVPDGPPHAYIGPSGETRLIVPHLRTFAYVGSSLGNVSLDCNDMISDSAQNADPNAYDDDVWPEGAYRLPDGSTFAVNHHEYHAPAHGMNDAGTWFAALTLSEAPDGVHFARVPGDHTFARPPSLAGGGAFANDGKRHGYSDPTNLMRNPADGNYYLVALIQQPTVRNCVLRTADVADVTAWRAWDGNAYSSQTQTGGDCVDFTTGKGFFSPGSLTYADTLGTSIYVAFGVDSAQRQGFFAFFDVSATHDLSAWSDPLLILEAAVPWGENPSTSGRASWVYPSLIDPAAAPNFDHVGAHPYLYFITGIGDRNVTRVPVELVPGSAEIRNRGQGFYRVGGGAYYSNGFNQYCGISSMAQLQSMGFIDPFDHLMPFADHGALADGRTCGQGGPVSPSGALPAEFFHVGGSGYFANGAGHVCAIVSMAQWTAMGGPAWDAAPSLSAIPATETLDGDCRLPQGFFFHGPTGSYANDAGHYCDFASWEAWIAAGGPPNPQSVASYPTMPAGQAVDAPCILPAGFFFTAGAGYYANATGHYCAFDSWSSYIAAGGPANTSALPDYSPVPTSEVFDGTCAH